MMSQEAWIESQPSLANSGAAAAPTMPAPTLYELGPGCRTADHDRRSCPGCSRAYAQVELQEARTALQAVKAQPAPTAPKVAEVPAPAPSPVTTAAPAVDPTTPSGMILRAASALAQAIDRCMKLSTKITGLECSLETARKEQIEADAVKDAAQEALRKLVEVKP